LFAFGAKTVDRFNEKNFGESHGCVLRVKGFGF